MTDPPQAGLPPIARLVFETLEHEGALAGCELRRSVSARRSADTPLVSIYRALALLRTRGLVVQSVAGRRWALRRGVLPDTAILLVCSSCGSLAQRDAENLADAARALAASRRFKLAEIHLELVGSCADCRSDPTRPAPRQKIGHAR